VSARFDDSTGGEAAAPDRSTDVAALWRGLLRMPSQRPQKGRQAIRDVIGDEGWAGADGDFARAVVVTPAAFTWKRAVRSLVELPALWSTLPLGGRDPDALWLQARAILGEHGVPGPHHVVVDDDTLTLLWFIEPLRRPKEGKPAFHFRCFEEQLQYWRWAVLKLSYVFEPLGARPLDPSVADEALLGFVPLPPLPGAGLARHAAELGLRPARLLPVGDGGAGAGPVRIAAVSKPLRRCNERLFQALGRPRPGRRRWRETEVSRAAREPQAAGARHPAALKLACAHRWDGLSREASLAELRTWAATCERDGAFPGRAGGRDELEALVDWAEQTLQAGGPTPRGDVAGRGRRQRRRTSRDHVAAAVCGFLAGADGVFAGTLAELGKRAALWSLDHGVDQPVPLRTLKRAVVDLVGVGELVHDVVRVGATWSSTFRLRADPSSSSSSSPLSLPPSSPPSSTSVAPAWPDAVGESPVVEERRPAGSPDPGVLAAEGLSEGQQAESMWAPAPPVDSSGLSDRGGSGGAFPLSGGSGGDSLLSSSSGRPRQRRLPLPRTKRSRSPRSPGEGVPPIDEALVNALADVGRHLNSVDHRALLEEARAGLFARPRLLADFAGALRRRALRLLRLREIAAASAAHTEARRRAEARAVPPPLIDDRDADIVFADFRRMLAAQVKPLHERTAPERARRLFADGLSLLALPPRSKKPSSSWKPQQTTRQSLRLLEQDLEAFGPEAGLAVVCGEVSGVVVADFDDAAAVAWARRHLPDTPWKTQTARGEHWYYRLPVQPTGAPFVPPASLPWKGELRAAGHYVVAPGSWHPDGVRYVALGDWSVSRDALPEWPGLAREGDELLRLRRARQRILKGS
jgi:hypothetical protein